MQSLRMRTCVSTHTKMSDARLMYSYAFNVPSDIWAVLLHLLRGRRVVDSCPNNGKDTKRALAWGIALTSKEYHFLETFLAVHRWYPHLFFSGSYVCEGIEGAE